METRQKTMIVGATALEVGILASAVMLNLASHVAPATYDVLFAPAVFFADLIADAKGLQSPQFSQRLLGLGVQLIAFAAILTLASFPLLRYATKHMPSRVFYRNSLGIASVVPWIALGLMIDFEYGAHNLLVLGFVILGTGVATTTAVLAVAKRLIGIVVILTASILVLTLWVALAFHLSDLSEIVAWIALIAALAAAIFTIAGIKDQKSNSLDTKRHVTSHAEP